MRQNGLILVRGKIVLASIIVFVIAATIFIFRKNTAYVSGNYGIESAFNEPILAIYDRSPVSRGQLSTSVEHISIVLDKFATRDFFENLANGLEGKGRILLTVKLSGKADGSLLKEISSGAFDSTFKLLFETLKQHKPSVLVRLNPEMEVPVKIYPWQYQSSRAYADAFRHFARLCRISAPTVSIVWGPAGYPGTEEYYPGDDFTDVVSITLGTEAEKKLDAYPAYPNIQTEVKRKLHRLRFMDKPVLILGQRKMESSAVREIENGLEQIRAESSIIYSTAKVEKGKKLTGRKHDPVVGVYDPKLLLTNSASVNVEHIFIDLAHVQNGTFEKDFNAIIRRKHSPLVSFEPWRDQKMRGDTNVLLNTINGVYDEEFRELNRIMKSSGQTVYLRFAHEMEIPIHRYAWQSQDPVLYIKAFRYFMEFGGRDNNIKRIWGPAGDRGSLEWWPGDDAVDFISIAIYGLPDKNITDPKMQESFSTIYDRKFHRVSLVGKPIFITEFGVKGPEDYKQQWIEDAAELIRDHKEIVGVSYFNLADNPKAWGDIPAPDWSIKRVTFDKFIKKLSGQ